MEANEKHRKSKFHEYLADVRRSVESWPEWKRNVLAAIDESHERDESGEGEKERQVSNTKIPNGA